MTRYRHGVFALLALGFPAFLVSQEARVELARSVRQIVDEEMARQRIPGLSVAIAFAPDDIVAFPFGTADLEHSVAVTNETVFRTASIAKPITATAIMTLVEAGTIDLDDSIRDHCPVFGEKRWPVTLRQLLGHLGGVRHYRGDEAIGTEHHFSLDDAIRRFSGDRLVHEPGTKFSYSTYGFVLLGSAIEHASGLSYSDFIIGKICEPAGMTHTHIDDHFAIMPNRARGYLRLSGRDLEEVPPGLRKSIDPDGLINARLHDTSMKTPAGGLVSTPADLARFAATLLAGGLLARETTKLMWSRQKLRDGRTGYGLGWDLGEDRLDGEDYVFHTGRQAGARGGLYLIPERELTIAVLCNLENAEIRTIVERVAEAASRARDR